MGIFEKTYKENKDELLPFFWKLSSLEGIGIKTYEAMQTFFDSPKSLFLSGNDKREKCGIFSEKQINILSEASDIDVILREYEVFVKKTVKYISVEEDDFPKRLKNLADCPIGLFFIGNLPDENVPSVGVIGARECSFYGEEVAANLGETLGTYGISVISGMARGIDSISQQSALNAGGKTYAVLGGGPDVCYPRESYKLFERLKEEGGIISEYPPGTKPAKMHFVRRNRIISGLSDALCVVEAKSRSGTLITVDCALEQGRDVVAVPGRVTDRTSMGCNELIRQGAEIMSDPELFATDIIERFGGGICKKDKTASQPVNKCKMSFLEMLIIKNVSEDSFMPEELLRCEDMKQYTDAYQLLTACMNLSYEGFLINMGGGRFRLSSTGIGYKMYVGKITI